MASLQSGKLQGNQVDVSKPIKLKIVKTDNTPAQQEKGAPADPENKENVENIKPTGSGEAQKKPEEKKFKWGLTDFDIGK